MALKHICNKARIRRSKERKKEKTAYECLLYGGKCLIGPKDYEGVVNCRLGVFSSSKQFNSKRMKEKISFDFATKMKHAKLFVRNVIKRKIGGKHLCIYIRFEKTTDESQQLKMNLLLHPLLCVACDYFIKPAPKRLEGKKLEKRKKIFLIDGKEYIKAENCTYKARRRQALKAFLKDKK